MIKVDIKPIENSEVEIEGELAADLFEAYRAKALADLGSEAEFDGFRKGAVPEKILVEKLGEEKILFEMANLALQKLYPEIIIENKLPALGRPEITITKIAKGNPFGFKIKTAVYPEVKLGDYKSLVRENMPIEEEVIVSDKEVEDTIEEIRKQRAVQVAKTDTKEASVELPELTDEFAKSIGKFESVADLKAKLKDSIKLEKEHRARDDRRMKIVEAIAGKSTFTLPAILIDGELNKMISELKMQIEQMGLTLDGYLAHLKKTEAELKDAWKPDAIKRVNFSLIVDALAKAEDIKADEAAITKELEHIIGHYPDTDPERARGYAENLLTTEKVLEFIDGLK